MVSCLLDRLYALSCEALWPVIVNAEPSLNYLLVVVHLCCNWHNRACFQSICLHQLIACMACQVFAAQRAAGISSVGNNCLSDTDHSQHHVLYALHW